MEKKYIFFDVDGTLRTHDERMLIPESTKIAIQKLIENGHFVALATGRPLFMARDLAKQFNMTGHVSEGGHIVSIDGKIIYEKPMDFALVKSICDEAKANNIPFSICTKEAIYCIDDTFKKAFANDSSSINIVDPQLDISQHEAIYKVYLQMNIENQHVLPSIKDLFKLFIGNDLVIIETDEKYVGIQKVIEHENANEKDVIVFGDGMNDIKMFQSAAYSVAMGNGAEQLKQIASFVTKDVEDDGIEYACKYLGLIE